MAPALFHAHLTRQSEFGMSCQCEYLAFWVSRRGAHTVSGSEDQICDTVTQPKLCQWM